MHYQYNSPFAETEILRFSSFLGIVGTGYHCICECICLYLCMYMSVSVYVYVCISLRYCLIITYMRLVCILASQTARPNCRSAKLV